MTNTIGVLIVDDEEIDVATIQRSLITEKEFTVFTAAHYDQAEQVFGQHGPNEIVLALIDVTLPGKNGVELAKRLLALNPQLRILFISGHVGASVIRFYGIEAGDEHFLQKPFDHTTLLKRVHEALVSEQPLRLPETSAGS